MVVSISVDTILLLEIELTNELTIFNVLSDAVDRLFIKLLWDPVILNSEDMELFVSIEPDDKISVVFAN